MPHCSTSFRRFSRLAALACLPAASLLWSVSAGAQTIGNNNNANCYPVSCFAGDGGSVYQEAYTSTAFSGTTTIGSASFFQAIGGAMDSATYDISFYLTSAAPLGLSKTLNDNLGTLLADWGTVSISGDMPSVLTLTGSQFSYDPSLGNLLMEVTVLGSTALNGYQSFFEADDLGSDIGRAYCNSGGCAAGEGALVTEFGPGVTVPEPASLALLGVGVAGLVSVRRRRASV